MKILYCFASRSRPEQFFEVLNNVKNLSASHDYNVIAKLDEDDKSMNNEDIRKLLTLFPEVIVRWGLSSSKIHAINRSMHDLPDYQILVNLSDDQRFMVKGFDEIIKNNIEEGKHFYHYMEDFATNRVAVMNITTKEYYERRGFIYSDEYYSMFCDEEETSVAKILDVYKLCPENIFVHYHYSQRGDKRIPKDLLYARNDTYRSDERVFIKRKARNFDLVNTHTHN